MMHHEAEKFMDEVLAELWPDYEPTGRIANLWKSILVKLDYVVAEKAAEELKLNKFSGKTPDPGKFREIADKLVKEDSGTRLDGGNLQETDVFIICTEPDAMGAGFIYPVYVPPLGCKVDTDIVVKRAHEYAFGVKDDAGKVVKPGLDKLYGGKWEVYQGCTYPQMTELRRDLQKKFPPKHKQKGNLGDLTKVLKKQ
jgi:hypothetical protein